jgi:hypothetical protein
VPLAGGVTLTVTRALALKAAVPAAPSPTQLLRQLPVVVPLSSRASSQLSDTVPVKPACSFRPVLSRATTASDMGLPATLLRMTPLSAASGVSVSKALKLAAVSASTVGWSPRWDRTRWYCRCCRWRWR